MAEEAKPIRLRLDVDYPYASRSKSLFYLALGIKRRRGRDYLKNARVIAKMINESPRQVKAYWFFTPYTIPDKKLLELLNPERHEVALHVAKDPYEEWKVLENETDRTVQYYTMHGTERVFAQLIWGRKIGEKQLEMPTDFPLKCFQDEGEYRTYSLDRIRFQLGFDGALREAEAWVRQSFILSMHPEWLFKKGPSRGPFYDVLRDILAVDRDVKVLYQKKRWFATTAVDTRFSGKGTLTCDFLEKLVERRVAVYGFSEPTWCCPIHNPPDSWAERKDNVALLKIEDYPSWLNKVGKKTRNMIRKAEKSGIKVIQVEPNDQLAKGISEIYNETQIRQGRAFTHYNEPLVTVAGNMYAGAKDSTFVGAYLNEELVGFIQINWNENAAQLSQILSKQKYWDKAVNNALLAKAVEVCAGKGQQYLTYGRIGNHPSLDRFKESNGFANSEIRNYYVPLTRKGRLAIRLGLHLEWKDRLPRWLKRGLTPIVRLVSKAQSRWKRGPIEATGSDGQTTESPSESGEEEKS